MTKQIKTWQERVQHCADEAYQGYVSAAQVASYKDAEIAELRAELDLLQSDSYEAIWQALQRIETAILCLPTFEVEVDGGVDACAENIVRAIIKAADILKSKPAAPVNQVLFDALKALWTASSGYTDAEISARVHARNVMAQAQPAVQLREGCTQYVEAAQPAKREPLATERINDLWDANRIPLFDGKMGINPVLFARDIEAAHGITKGQQ